MLQDFKIVFDMLLSVVGAFFGFLAFLFNFAMNSGVSLSPLELLKCLFIAALLCGSAFLSASEAEKKEHKRFSHFILGLIFPYLYPLLIHFTLPQALIRKDDTGPSLEDQRRSASQKDLTMKLKDRQKDTLAKFAHKAPAVETQPIEESKKEMQQETVFVSQAEVIKKTEEGQRAVLQEEQKQPQPEPTPQPEPDIQKYYAAISTDENGKPTGPFILELSDGRTVEALKITGALPELLEIEIPAAQDDSPSRRIRLPYSKISKCVLKSQWING